MADQAVWGIPPSAMHRMTELVVYGDTWFWCRYHERAESIQQSVNEVCPGSPCREQERQGTHTHIVCVRVGPFMSEREANRLGERHRFGNQVDPALGMEAEK